MWKKGYVKDEYGIGRPAIICSDTKEVIFNEKQLDMFSHEFVNKLCSQHNNALLVYGKWNRDMVMNEYSKLPKDK